MQLIIHKMHFTEFPSVMGKNIKMEVKEIMSYLVVGIECRTSKKSGKSYKMLHLSQPFTDVKYGIGSRTSVEYVPDDKIPQGLNVGNAVELTYGRGFDGKAYVNGVHIVSEDVPTIEVKK